MKTVRDLRVAIFLAVRSLARGNAGVTVMTVLMLAVVFVSVVFLPSLINGAVQAIEAQVTNTTTGDLNITPDNESVIDDARSYLDRIAAVDGVAAVTGTRRVGNQIAFGGDSNVWGVDAVDPVTYAQVFTTPDHMIEGSWLEPGDLHGIVLGVDIAGADLTDLRGYAGSLRSVHVGDTVKVTLIGGEAKRFTVRGIFNNQFVLSDQGAFVTTAAADALEPSTDYAALVQAMFDATDRLSRTLARSADGAAQIADSQAALTSAAGDVADGARALAVRAGQLEVAASDLAEGAERLTSSAVNARKGARSLARAVSTLSNTFSGTIVPAADRSAQSAADVATTAATLAAGCPGVSSDPDHCAAEAALAASAADVATEAATTAGLVHAAADSLADIASTADALADGAAELAKAASDLADGAVQVSSGSTAAADAVTRLRDAAVALASRSDDLTRATARLSSSLSKASQATGSSAQDRKDLTKALTPRTEFPGPDTVSRVFVKLHDGVSPRAAQASIEGLRDDVEYRSSEELTAAIQDQIDTFRLINDIMRVISLLVAAITVFILTYVELTNRRRQIGIERAIGIRGSAIVSTYVLKSVISALVGVGLGLIAYRAAIVPFVERHPFHFPNGDVVLVADPSTTQQNVAMLLVVAVIAALVPTANAVRMRILDAIWGR